MLAAVSSSDRVRPSLLSHHIITTSSSLGDRTASGTLAVAVGAVQGHHNLSPCLDDCIPCPSHTVVGSPFKYGISTPRYTLNNTLTSWRWADPPMEDHGQSVEAFYRGIQSKKLPRLVLLTKRWTGSYTSLQRRKPCSQAQGKLPSVIRALGGDPR